jgi:hypothetical protein
MIRSTAENTPPFVHARELDVRVSRAHVASLTRIV